jgi:colanic acid biosynthesis glycosyl transferase WcaI
MKILFFCQYYPPESNAPAIRTSEMAERWVFAGHDVTVLTAFPHHPTGVIPPRYAGRFFMRETRNGVKVVHTYVYVAANKGVIRRSLSFFSWMFSAIVFGVTRVSKPDVIVATSPQFLCAVAGFVVSRFKRVPYVMEVRDLWPESIVAVGALKEGSFVVRMLRRMERYLYRKAHRVVTVSPGFAPYLESNGCRGKLAYLPNGVDLDRFSPTATNEDLYTKNGVVQPFRVLYSGTVGMAHGLETAIDAGEKLRGSDVALVIVGDGARRNELIAEVERRKLDNVYFLPIQVRDMMPEWIRGASAVLVHLRPSDLFETVLPSKLFEYMGCGRPVLMGVRGTAANVVRESNCGWLFPPGDADALVSLIRDVRVDGREAQSRGEAGRKYVELHYDRMRLADRYISDILQPLIDGTSNAGDVTTARTDEVTR